MQPLAGRLSLALLIGAAGGGLFFWLDLPLPWMLGAMLATTLAAFAGAPVALPRPLRNGFVLIIGVMLGSAFTPDMLAAIPGWSAGVALLALYVPLTTILCYVFFRRAGGFGKVDSFFSAAPGGLNEMVIVGESYGGDARRIALVHTVRILIVVFLVPVYFRYFAGGYSQAARPEFGPWSIDARDAAILIAAGVAGWAFGRVVRLPAYHLIGPMAVSALVHLTGMTASKPPFYLVAVAQVVMGSAIGCRFVGVRLSNVGGTLLTGAAATLILLAVTALFTAVFGSLVPVGRSALTLALAPGGLAEMTLVALALAVDSAFVSCMHLVRITFVIVLAPIAFRLGWRPPG